MEEDRRKDAENVPEVSSKSEPSEEDNINKDRKNRANGSSKQGQCDKNTPHSLKAKPKIVKKSQPAKFKTKRNNGTQRIQGKQKNWRSNKKLQGNKEQGHNGEGSVEKQISEDSHQKRTADEQSKEKSQDAEKYEGKDGQNKSLSDKLVIGKSQEAQKDKRKGNELDKNHRKQKNKEKLVESNRGVKSIKSRNYEIKHGGMRSSQLNEKKMERLSGLIFVCSSKTKPDCFRYHLMGVSTSKKDVVLGIKPGLKLFLYDFDLKLLYGIYKASSSGGMKLEPKAFGGSFPAQVRFSIVKDCLPLPESIFRKAIKENYNEKHKFEIELTARQVQKLTELFRPVGGHSALQPEHSPQKPLIWNREAADDSRGLKPHSHWERSPRDHYTDSHGDCYTLVSHERDCQIEWRHDIPRDLFLKEKDYRPYSLQWDRRILTPLSHVDLVLVPYRQDYGPEHLFPRSPTYWDNIPPAHAEILNHHGYWAEREYRGHSHGARCDYAEVHPDYLIGLESQGYSHGARQDFAKDPCYGDRCGASSRDSNLPPFRREEISSRDPIVMPLRREKIFKASRDPNVASLRREEISSHPYDGRRLREANDLHRREAAQDRAYSTHAADAWFDDPQVRYHHGARFEAVSVPDSPRYSLAGHSYSHR